MNSEIILNYGIEIECVYNIIDDFINFINENIDKISLNKDLFKEFFKLNNKINIIDKNKHPLVFKIKEEENFNINNSNKKNIIDELSNILTNFLDKMNKNKYYSQLANIPYYLIENGKFDNIIFNNINQIIYNLSNNIIIYNDINKLLPSYNKDLSYKNIPSLSNNKIYLMKIKDDSVICDCDYSYTDLTSDIVPNNIIVNCFEFITEVFKNTDDINRKLSILYDKVKNKFLNCISTSQHVHISFNNFSNVIRPNNNHILFITSLCYIIQKDISKYVIYFRNDNHFCHHLNYHKKYKSIIFNKNDQNYNDNLIKIFKIFYDFDNNDNIYRKCRYFWLNLLNLYIIDDKSTIRPPTLEFRIKHGSNDSLELSNFCKLYEIIIKKGIELSDEFFKTHKSDEYRIEDVIKFINLYFFNKIFPSREISKEKSLSLSKSKYININYIQILLNDNRSLLNYFNNLHKKIKILNYVIINNNKNTDIIIKLPSSLPSSKLQSGGLSIYKNIFDKYAFYKLTSFGYSFIGYGLDEKIINNLKIIDIDDLKKLKEYGIIYKLVK